MTTYIGKTGECVGQADDEISMTKDTPEAAMVELLAYSDDQWSDSDVDYSAVCWIEDEFGNVIIAEDVEIGADGIRK